MFDEDHTLSAALLKRNIYKSSLVCAVALLPNVADTRSCSSADADCHAVEQFWDHWANELAILSNLFKVCLNVAAASASTERLFAGHVRCTKGRGQAGEDGINAQLLIYGYLLAMKSESKKCPFPEISEEKARWLLEKCWEAHRFDQALLLEDGKVVTVFFEHGGSGMLRNKKRGYLATLVSKHNALWKVRWHSDPKSQQAFEPLLDEWFMEDIEAQ